MKPEEIKKAIRGLKNIVEYWCNRPEEIETAKLAIAALEKQIPKKPIESEFTPLICPDCEAKVILGQRYCENCGQKINWEETP